MSIINRPVGSGTTNVLMGTATIGTSSIATVAYVDSKVLSGSNGSSGTSGINGSSGTSGVAGSSGSSGTSGTSTNIVLGNRPPTSGDLSVNDKYTNNDTRTVLGEPDVWIQITIGADVYNVPGYVA